MHFSAPPATLFSVGSFNVFTTAVLVAIILTVSLTVTSSGGQNTPPRAAFEMTR